MALLEFGPQYFAGTVAPSQPLFQENGMFINF